MINIKEKIIENKIIAIIRGVDKSDILKTVEALIAGGIELIEITLDHQNKDSYMNVLEMITLVNEEYQNKICLGAGTVITPEQVEDVIKRGVEYIISPNTDLEIIKKTKELNKISIPGAYTPSEIIKAYNSGADFVKLFPASNLGSGYVKSVLSPVNIPLLAVGGVNISNVKGFIKAGALGVGIGGSLIDKEAIKEKRYNSLTEKAKRYLEVIREIEEENNDV